MKQSLADKVLAILDEAIEQNERWIVGMEEDGAFVGIKVHNDFGRAARHARGLAIAAECVTGVERA